MNLNQGIKAFTSYSQVLAECTGQVARSGQKNWAGTLNLEERETQNSFISDGKPIVLVRSPKLGVPIRGWPKLGILMGSTWQGAIVLDSLITFESLDFGFYLKNYYNDHSLNGSCKKPPKTRKRS